jgi:hypothetical protein
MDGMKHREEVKLWLLKTQDLTATFARLDVNHDGLVSLSELQALADASVLSPEACAATIHMGDTDGDGQISLVEFERLGAVLQETAGLEAVLLGAGSAATRFDSSTVALSAEDAAIMAALKRSVSSPPSSDLATELYFALQLPGSQAALAVIAAAAADRGAWTRLLEWTGKRSVRAGPGLPLYCATGSCVGKDARAYDGVIFLRSDGGAVDPYYDDEGDSTQSYGRKEVEAKAASATKGLGALHVLARDCTDPKVLQAALSHAGGGAVLLEAKDSLGRLPMHWAFSGCPGPCHCIKYGQPHHDSSSEVVWALLEASTVLGCIPLGGTIVLNLVLNLVQGRGASKRDLLTRITVTLSIFNFRT